MNGDRSANTSFRFVSHEEVGVRVKVRVQKDRCCGAGQCVLIAPQVFDQDINDGTVILLQDNPPQGLHGLVVEAIEVCPTRAIKLIEESEIRAGQLE